MAISQHLVASQAAPEYNSIHSCPDLIILPYLDPRARCGHLAQSLARSGPRPVVCNIMVTAFVTQFVRFFFGQNLIKMWLVSSWTKLHLNINNINSLYLNEITTKYDNKSNTWFCYYFLIQLRVKIEHNLWSVTILWYNCDTILR